MKNIMLSSKPPSTEIQDQIDKISKPLVKDTAKQCTSLSGKAAIKAYEARKVEKVRRDKEL